MSKKKHIDHIFKEKLKNFEAMPDDAVWENIQNRLHKDKRKRKVIPIWWQAAGVAALLALLFTVGTTLFNNSEETNTNVVNTGKNASEQPNETINHNNQNTNVVETGTHSEGLINNSNEKKTNVDKTKTNTNVASSTNRQNKSNGIETAQSESFQNKKSVNNPTNEALAQNTSNLPEPNQNKSPDNTSGKVNEAETRANQNKDNTNSAGATVAANAALNKTDNAENTITEDSKTIIEDKKSIEDAIAEANSINEEEKEKRLNRWSISPNVAPVYFNSLRKGSTIHSQFIENGKSNEVNMSYGIGGSYAINEKIKVRAGINKVDLSYTTTNVVAFNDAGIAVSNGLRNISFNSQSQQNSMYMSAQSIDFASAPEIFKTTLKGSLDQQFGYIEIPLEVEYSVVNKKLGINIIGGFSTLFLNSNNIYSIVEGNRTLLGESNNINDMSYSANLGLGISYHISDKLKLNVEPMFKYQINTFNNTSGDFQPYFIGVYSGFSFKF